MLRVRIEVTRAVCCVQLGQLEVQRDAGARDADTREQLIKNHFTQRINDMTLQLQLADSKAVNFHAEVSAARQGARSCRPC